MLNLTYIKTWGNEKTFPFIRYLLVGGWNTVFGMAVYAGLYHWLGNSVHYLVLLIPSNILAITNAFACYKFFVFKTKGNVLREYFRCYVVYGGMMLVGAALMFVLVEALRLPPVIANCACIAVTTIISYFAHRDFSFKQNPCPSATPVPRTVCPLSEPEGEDTLLPADRPFPCTGSMIRTSSSRTALFIFWSFSILALLSHLVYMWSIPIPWMDGVCIHEFGRLFLTHSPLKSSLLVNPDGTSPTVFFYVGPVLQEVMYQIFGFIGPRLSPMLGLLIAACICRAWLLKKKNSIWLSTMLALMVLTCPVLTQSVRFVRIDTWNVALFFAIVYFIEYATNLPKHVMRRYFFIAGALTSLSMFVWPTSFVFIFYYIANFWAFRSKICTPRPETLHLILSAATGAGIMGVLFISPFVTRIDDVFNYLNFHFSHYISSHDVSIAGALMAKLKAAVLCFLKETLRDPLFMTTVAIGILSLAKQRLRNYAVWMICGLMALGVCVATGLYIYRYLYLLPFLFMLTKTGIQAIQKKHQNAAITLAVSLLCYGFVTSFLAPLTMACIYKGRSISNITERLRSAIGEGDKCVYVCSYQTYYPARMLDWRFYRYMVEHLLFEDAQNTNLLSRVDYVIDSIPSPCRNVVEEGFTIYSLIRDYSIRTAIDLSPKSGLTPGRATNLKDRINKIFADLGGSVVYAPNCETAYVKTEKYFMSKGFEKVCVLDFAPDDSVYSPFERWLLSKQIVNPNYDPLVIWRRSAKPDNRPNQNRQTR